MLEEHKDNLAKALVIRTSELWKNSSVKTSWMVLKPPTSCKRFIHEWMRIDLESQYKNFAYKIDRLLTYKLFSLNRNKIHLIIK